MMRLLEYVVLFWMVTINVQAQLPDPPDNYAPAGEGLTFEFLKVFPAQGGLLVGRFKLVNESSAIVEVRGKPSAMMEIIGMSPSQDIDAYATFVRLNERSDDDWIRITKPPNSQPVKSQSYELYPGEIRFVDLLLPNAQNKPRAELLVQLYLHTGEMQHYLNSQAFSISNSEER